MKSAITERGFQLLGCRLLRRFPVQVTYLEDIYTGNTEASMLDVFTMQNVVQLFILLFIYN